MRIRKISEEHILTQLNKRSWSKIPDKDDILIWDGDCTNSLTNGFDEESLRETIGNGEPFQVAREVTGLSPSDLQGENNYDVTIDDDGEEFLLRMLAPYTEGDWEFKDIFDADNEDLLQELFDEIYKTSMEFIKKNPQILSEKATYRTGTKWSYFIKPKKRKFRAATADEVTEFLEKREKERRSRKEDRTKTEVYQAALSKLSVFDRIALGI